MQQLAKAAHLPVLFAASYFVSNSLISACCVVLPYFAHYLASFQQRYYASAGLLLACCVMLVLAMELSRPNNIFELLDVRPDMQSSLHLRIKIKRLQYQLPRELLELAKLLVNDEARRRYIWFGPEMELGFGKIALWYLEAFIFTCSVANLQGDGGRNTNMLVMSGTFMLVVVFLVEMIEKHSTDQFIEFGALSAQLCTHEKFQFMRVFVVLIFSALVFELRFAHQDRKLACAAALDRISHANEEQLAMLKEKEE